MPLKTTRLTVGALGVLVGLYGGYLGWTRLPFASKLIALKWLVGGVIVHDGLIAAASIVVGLVIVRLLPDWTRAAVAVGAVILGTVTVLAIPVLGRYGARPANPTLLDRNYTVGWLIIAALVLIGVVVGALITRRSMMQVAHDTQDDDEGEQADGTGPGGRRRPHGA